MRALLYQSPRLIGEVSPFAPAAMGHPPLSASPLPPVHEGPSSPGRQGW